MQTEIENNQTELTNTGAAPVKTFTESEVEEMVRRRRERDAEALRLQHEENKRLKAKLEELESKAQKGTATVEEMTQLQTAKDAAAKTQEQGYSPEDVKNIIAWEMQQKELTSKLEEARDKDPEFAKLLKDGNKLFAEEVAETAYLPNAPAVIKLLMKDKKSLDLFRRAAMNYQRDGGTAVMMVLNNLSDQLAGTEEKPTPSPFKPAERLSDASDEDQNFDESDYISSKY
jgi:hypothetical protein